MKYITSLEDIAPLADQVVIRGEKLVRVKALELNEIGALVFKHAALKAAFEGVPLKEGQQIPASLFDAILAGGAPVVRDFVDAATGIPGLGECLNGVEQGNIILSCLNMTMPSTDEEVADFLDQIIAFAPRGTALMKAAEGRMAKRA